MSFGNILGQLLQNGLGGQTTSRIEQLGRSNDLGGSLGQLFGGLLGGGAGRTTGSGSDTLGNILNMAKDFLGKSGGAAGGGSGGLNMGQLGGLGALAGALLGGKQSGSPIKGALGGSAMAILGSLALNALQARMAGQRDGGATEQVLVDDETLQSLVAPDTERLLVRAMISAAKADGQIDQEEMQRIAGKIGEDGVSAEEKQMVMDELRRPLDLAGLVAEVPNAAVASQVYGASLLAINVDTEQEASYLRSLAAGLKLDPATVARLHELTGAPKV